MDHSLARLELVSASDTSKLAGFPAADEDDSGDVDQAGASTRETTPPVASPSISGSKAEVATPLNSPSPVPANVAPEPIPATPDPSSGSESSESEDDRNHKLSFFPSSAPARSTRASMPATSLPRASRFLSQTDTRSPGRPTLPNRSSRMSLKNLNEEYVRSAVTPKATSTSSSQPFPGSRRVNNRRILQTHDESEDEEDDDSDDEDDEENPTHTPSQIPADRRAGAGLVQKAFGSLNSLFSSQS